MSTKIGEKTTPYNSLAEITNDLEAHISEVVQNGRQDEARPPQDHHEFPLHRLPEHLRHFIRNANKTRGLPIDFLAAATLFTAGAAVGNACKLERTPGELHPALFFMGIIGDPNSAKSPALKLALEPLKAADAEAYQEYVQAVKDYEKEKADGAEPSNRPTFNKIVLSDATPEAMAGAHKQRRRGIVVVKDELISLVKNLNRYNQGDELELWLSLWSADSINVTRKTSAPILIQDSFVGVIGGIQPKMMEFLAGGDRSKNGFLSRFLWAYPPATSKPRWTSEGINKKLCDAYHQAIKNLLHFSFDPTDQKVVTMAPEAQSLFERWANEINNDYANRAEDDLIKEIHGKLDLYCLRLTLALHLLRWSYSDMPLREIDAEAMEAGIEVVEYFRRQSMRVHDLIFSATPYDRLPKNKQLIYDELPEQFKTGDALKIAAKHGVRERTLKNWLQDKFLFVCLDHGKHGKTL